VGIPLNISFSAIRLELQMISRRRISPRWCSAVITTMAWRIPVSRREAVLVPTPGDERRHHSTAPAKRAVDSSLE
jgi:hypothetical protein